MPHCTIVYLVGLYDLLPSDDIGNFDCKQELVIGCNSLACLRCEAMVKHVDARAINQAYPPPRSSLEELYYSKDPASSELLDGRPFRAMARTFFCRCDWYTADSARSLNFLDQNWACGGHEADLSAVTYHHAAGERATKTVESLDAIEPELAAWVRKTALLLDPSFPQSGTRGPGQRGQWKDDEQLTTLMTQVNEFDREGRGLTFIRTLTPRVPGEPHEGVFRVNAAGLAAGAQLEIWWNTITSVEEVRGVSMRLEVAGSGKASCIAAFHQRFGLPSK